jgi:predicted secreted protein
MSISAAIVVFAICWFLVFFMVLPWRVTSQGEAGSVVPGTPSSAPAHDVVKRKAQITTLIAVVVWAAICGTIMSGWIGVRDFDLAGVMGPDPAPGETGE